MDRSVEEYIAAVAPEHRQLFDRIHGLIMGAHPDAQLTLAYDMPAYRLGKRRLNLGVWKHGVSLYGWRRDRDGGFVARHPSLLSGKSTIRIRPQDAEGISDEEIRALVGGALEP
jgi:hypothetical protein